MSFVGHPTKDLWSAYFSRKEKDFSITRHPREMSVKIQGVVIPVNR